MKDIWTNRLSEYVDGELDSTERAALEEHLATCGHCYAALADLRDVVARAKTLTDREPAKDLWAGIRAGLTTAAPIPLRRDRPVRRRFSLTVGQLLAASIALVLMSVGGMWLGLRHEGVTPRPIAEREAAGSGVRQVDQRAERWRVQSDMAIAELQDALELNESKLDTATVRIVRENLAVIDRAIAQAQHALRRDPGNTYLNLHLAKSMRQKIELLRRANALAES
jgi:anti-sigma factor RsiW